MGRDRKTTKEVHSGIEHPKLSREEITLEFKKCYEDVAYFVANYCYIDDKADGTTFKFDLWPDQRKVLTTFCSSKQVAVLKARQVGLTWLALCYALYIMMFKPGVTVLLFSLRDEEAMELLSRLKRMYYRLPTFLRCKTVIGDDAHDFMLGNNSQAKAFPTGRGDSYTAALAIFDEADIVPEKMQRQMITSVKPTIDAGGQLFLISKADKQKPMSLFKTVYNEAKRGGSEWKHAFLPWYSKPSRTQDWYDQEKSDMNRLTGSDDMFFENYPESDIQALAPASLDKRIPNEWLQKCYQEILVPTIVLPPLRHINGLKIYKEPVPSRKYVIGADPAEGNPTSDYSALVVLDYTTGEEIASLNAKLTPKRLAQFIIDINKVYNKAKVLVERNNHGHAVILFIQENVEDGGNKILLSGMDGKVGWLESSKSKSMLYDTTTETIRERDTLIHTPELYNQLTLIEGDTLSAPEPMHDDLAMAYVLALKAIKLSVYARFKEGDYKGFATPQGETPFGMMVGGSNMPFGLN